MEFVNKTCKTTIENIRQELTKLQLLLSSIPNNDVSQNDPLKSSNASEENAASGESSTQSRDDTVVLENGRLADNENESKETETADANVTKHAKGKGKNDPRWHNQKRRNRRKRAKGLPIEADIIFSNLSNIRNITLSLMEASHAQLMTDKVTKCCRDLESLSTEFRAYTSGSRALGLCDDHGDLDIFLDVGNMFYGDKFQHAFTQEKLVVQMANLLRKHKRIWCNVIAITSARTPIVKAFHVPSNLNCDISFRSGLGNLNTGLIRSMIEAVPVLRPLILLLKLWCRTATIDNHFRSYCLTIMLIFYLQVENILPSVTKMRSFYKGKPIYVSGWEVHYSKRPAVFSNLTPPLSFIQLLRGFFHYYGNVFQFDTEVVCPLLGRTILKSDFEYSGESLPNEMNSYKDMVAQCTNEERDEFKINTFLVSHPSKELFRNNAAACVQDPFDLSHNLTKAVPRDMVTRFRLYCEIQASQLNGIINSLEGQSYDDGFWKNVN